MRHIDWGVQQRRRRPPSSRSPTYDPDGYDADSSLAPLDRSRRSYGAGPAWNAVKRKLWEKLVQPERAWVDLGVGFNFDLDTASLLPKASFCCAQGVKKGAQDFAEPRLYSEVC